MLKFLQIITYFIVAVIGMAPIVLSFKTNFNILEVILGILNLVVSSFLIYYLIDRNKIKEKVDFIVKKIGLNKTTSIFSNLENVESELNKSFDVLTTNVLEKKITNKNQLSETLEELVTVIYRYLDAKSAELALYDSESGQYNSALVLGAPSNSSAQAMLSEASDGNSNSSPGVMVQQILFAGSILGSIRISLKNNKVASESDWKFLKAMSLQSGLAILNAEYSKQLIKMKMSGEESMKAKTGFLATLSHEIRGPLGVMLNAAELVLDGLCGEVNEEQVETLSMIKTNGAHLLELVNDVLDYAKVESGKLTPKLELIKVNDLLHDIYKVVRAQADVKKHKLRVISCDEQFAFQCDRRHARQILINLLTNAIKYTPDGGDIEISAVNVNNFIKIKIKDNGVGIAEVDHDKVFSAFERIDNSYSSKQIGTGLGMSLTQALVRANSGNIGFESSLGNGSTFWISFALELVNEATIKNEEIELDAKGNGELILVIESEEGERKMMARYLEHVGYKAIMANDQAQAINLFQQEEFSLVIVDNRVFDSKEYNEQELVRLIKNSTRKIPVVLVSSKAFVFDIEKALKDGVDICVVKPIGMKKLGNIVQDLLSGYVKTNIEESIVLDSLTKYLK